MKTGPAILCALIITSWAVLLTTLPVPAYNISFEARPAFYPGGTPSWVTAGDLDNDGIPDLAVTLYDFDEVTVLLGDGHGYFDGPIRNGVANAPTQVELGDFNDDGKLDLAVAHTGTNKIAVLRGNGDGTSQEAAEYVTGPDSRALAIGDLDNDGDLDLAVTVASQHQVAILLGHGNGTFQAATYFATGNTPDAIVVDDFDDDGNLDLATANNVTNNVSVLLGNGDGSFAAPAQNPIGGDPTSIATTDLNGDGNPDLVAANAGTDNISVLMGNGDGSFQSAVHHPVGDRPLAITTGDFDGDGHHDLAVAVYLDYMTVILNGNGDGTFKDPVIYEAGKYPSTVRAVDLDLDGHTDLVIEDQAVVSSMINRGDGTFTTAAHYTTGISARSVVVGNLNGDHHPDLFVSSLDGIDTLLGTAGGTFLEGFTLHDGIFSLDDAALADLNGDGLVDAAVVDGGNVMMLSGAGDGSFLDPEIILAGHPSEHIQAGDLNGDGIIDLVMDNLDNILVTVLIGSGGGTYESPVSYGIGNFYANLVLRDLNGDGVLDLAVVDYWATLYILTGSGDGTFAFTGDYQVGPYPTALAAGHLNGDGILDLAVGSEAGGGSVQLVFGSSDGTYAVSENLATAGAPTSVVIGDLNRDGYDDLAATVERRSWISIWTGSGTGTFFGPLNYGTSGNPVSLILEDFDHDQYLDLALTHYSSTIVPVSVLLNSSSLDTMTLLIAGPGPAELNPPLVRVFQSEEDGNLASEFDAYGPDRYGVNVTSGNVYGPDGSEIITGAGPGAIYGPHVRGFLQNGEQIPGLSFLAYGTNRWGVNVAAGNLDGEGFDEIITGAGPGEVFGPHVRGWTFDGGMVSTMSGVNYFAYGTPKWGVNVAAGDIDGDNIDEIITGAGPGAIYGPHVRGWNVDGGVATSIPGVSFLAYGTNKFGVRVSAGDVDGDGIDEIVTGAGPGEMFGPHVRGWNYDGDTVTPLPGYSFFAWESPVPSYGVNVFSGIDLDMDGRDEVVAGPGPDPSAGTPVRVFVYDGSEVTLLFSLDAYDDLGLTHGATVAAGMFDPIQ